MNIHLNNYFYEFSTKNSPPRRQTFCCHWKKKNRNHRVAIKFSFNSKDVSLIFPIFQTKLEKKILKQFSSAAASAKREEKSWAKIVNSRFVLTFFPRFKNRTVFFLINFHHHQHPYFFFSMVMLPNAREWVSEEMKNRKLDTNTLWSKQPEEDDELGPCYWQKMKKKNIELCIFSCDYLAKYLIKQ